MDHEPSRRPRKQVRRGKSTYLGFTNDWADEGESVLSTLVFGKIPTKKSTAQKEQPEAAEQSAATEEVIRKGDG